MTVYAVIELQKMSLNREVEVSQLLEYAYAIAYKLKDDQLIKFCSDERGGYEASEIVPPYRVIVGDVYTKNNNGNFIPVVLSGANKEYFKVRIIKEPISYIQSIVHMEDQFLSISLDEGIHDFLYNEMLEMEARGLNRSIQGIVSIDCLKEKGHFYVHPPFLYVNRISFESILNAIRREILNWSLKLELEGILGEGLIFSVEEKEVVKSIQYNIGTVVNMANHNEESSIKLSGNIQQGDFNSLSTELTTYGISAEDVQELKSILGEGKIEPEKVKSWIIRAASKVIGVTKDVATNIITALVTGYLGSPV